MEDQELDEMKTGYWPKRHRSVALVRLTQKGLDTYPGTALRQVCLNAIIEAVKNSDEVLDHIGPDGLEMPLTNFAVDMLDVMPYLAKHIRTYKKVPQDATLDEVLIITKRHGTKELTVHDYLYSKAGPYYYLMTYLKHLDIGGFIERLTDAGQIVVHQARIREKKTIKQSALEALQKGDEKHG